jgi:glyoxylate reductase
MAKRVLVTGKHIEDRYLEDLHGAGFEISNPHQDLTESQLIRELRGKHAYLLAGPERATERVIRASPDLELIAFLGIGYQSYINADVATERGVAITNAPGGETSVAELTVGHLVNLRRGIGFLNTSFKQGQIIREKSHDLDGQILGVLGMGPIGQIVARMLHVAFGMQIIYASRTSKPAIESEIEARFVSIDEVLRESDAVTLHLPLVDETRGMLGEAQLAMMKKHALLINTARPDIVDGHALRKALVAGTIAGAAYDGYYIEPHPDLANDAYGLLSLGDHTFVATPHIASLTDSAWNRMTEKAITSIKTFFATETDTNIVNPGFENRRRSIRLPATGI